MPYTTAYVDDGKGVHKTGTGIVSGLEIFSSALQQSMDETRARKLRYGLIDFTGTTELKVTPDDIRRIVEMNRKTATFAPGIRVAIVAPASLTYAMARLWHTLSDDLGWKSNLFHNRSDALAWLRKEFEAQVGSDAILGDYPSLRIEAF